MRRAIVVAGIAVAALACLLGALPWRATPSERHLPVVVVDLQDAASDDLFRRRTGDDGGDVPVLFADRDTAPTNGKASLRGFSPWHHGRTKPSLRIEQRASASPLRPRWVELSRPEDPLALSNWLPDQLSSQQRLLHAFTTPVRLQLDRTDRGVYLRSLRPGDDLAATAGRARGTFWKGDALGDRRHRDLWADPSAWRATGASAPRAVQLLSALLNALRAPADADNLDRIAAVLDLHATASAAAIAVLVGSIHADRAHNHVLFADPSSDCLEPLLWDANGFGIHAEATLPVDVARHPLAARLLCDPAFVQARNHGLWDLLQNAGSARALLAAARLHVANLTSAFANDPELARLRLHRGQFVVEALAASAIPQEVERFAAFVTAREHHLRAYFADARVAVAADPADAQRSIVTVFGSVAVTATKKDGSSAFSTTGHSAAWLPPGLSLELFAAPQHRADDGTGVAAPHARPAALHYTLAAASGDLCFRNAFTNEVVAPTTPAGALATRSVHPWTRATPPAELRLGPGQVHLTTSLDLAATTTLILVAGTKLALGKNVTVRTRGPVFAQGSAEQPITIEVADSTAFLCVGASVTMTHVTLRGLASPLLALCGTPAATLKHCTLHSAGGHGLSIAGGNVVLLDTEIALCRGHGLAATAGAKVNVRGGRLAFCDHGAVASDAASVQLVETTITGNMVGVLAEAGCGVFAGGSITLVRAECREQGRCDVDRTGDGALVLTDTKASLSARAAASQQPTPLTASGTNAAPTRSTPTRSPTSRATER